MRWFRRWVRLLTAFLVITALTFFLFFLIAIGDNDNNVFEGKSSHDYTSHYTSMSLTNSVTSKIVRSHPFRPSFFLRRNSSSLPVNELRSIVHYNRLLNINDFEFLMNSSHVCSSRVHPFLIALVHSSPVNFKKRNIIRRTWASINQVNGLTVNVVFIIGQVTDVGLQKKLDHEYHINGDLVQGTFIDSYHNLTYKHLCGYKWVLTYCNLTRFVMKADDDAFIDIFRAVKVLKETFDNDNDVDNLPKDILACSVFPDGTSPMRHGKWSLTLEQYPYQTFPSYCSGVAYFMTIDVLYDIFEGAHRIHPVLRIDDVYLTGIVAAALRLRHLPLNLRYAYDVSKLREWLFNGQMRPCSYMIGDIGDVLDWDSLILKLWTKTAKAWNHNGINFSGT